MTTRTFIHIDDDSRVKVTDCGNLEISSENNENEIIIMFYSKESCMKLINSIRDLKIKNFVLFPE